MAKDKVLIKNIVVIALPEDGRNPIGEAALADHTSQEMSAEERKKMTARIQTSIDELIDITKKDHDENRKKGCDITRTSTNEFYFYTKEPLTLQEFEDIQNHIHERLKSAPEGIHLILGSFAVKTEDGKVMNVCPHISSGPQPQFKFIVKNNTSPIDVNYKNSSGESLDMIDASTAKENELAHILINGNKTQFTFNNIVHNKLENKEEFITLLDICYDHFLGTAKKYMQDDIKNLWQSNPLVSHVVISNSVAPNPDTSLGEILHADPFETPKKVGVDSGVNPGATSIEKCFGFNAVDIYEVDLRPLQSLHEIEEEFIDKESFKFEKKACLTQLKYLRNKTPSANDILLNTFADSREQSVQGCKNRFELDALSKEVAELSKNLLKPLNEEIHTLIDKFRLSYAFGASAKADRIEQAYINIPIEQRANLKDSSDETVKKLMKAIASPRHTFLPTSKDSPAKSFINMKQRFSETLENSIKSESDDEAKPPGKTTP